MGSRVCYQVSGSFSVDGCFGSGWMGDGGEANECMCIGNYVQDA